MLAERPEYLASISLESRRLPDVYSFTFSGGKLMSPTTGLPVEQSISIQNHLDELEYGAFVKLQDWVNETDSGVAFWISPPHSLRSPQTKIIISELESRNFRKEIINRSILFDADSMQSVGIANKISDIFGFGLQFRSVEEVRSQPIFYKGEVQTQDWLGVVESIIAENAQWEMVASGEDFVEVERTLGSIAATGVVSKGTNPVSCPPGLSPFGAMSRHSLEGKMVRSCGKCGVVINKVIFKGYKCSNCGGEYLGC